MSIKIKKKINFPLNYKAGYKAHTSVTSDPDLTVLIDVFARAKFWGSPPSLPAVLLPATVTAAAGLSPSPARYPRFFLPSPPRTDHKIAGSAPVIPRSTAPLESQT
jgi:hypothetical protein